MPPRSETLPGLAAAMLMSAASCTLAQTVPSETPADTARPLGPVAQGASPAGASATPAASGGIPGGRETVLPEVSVRGARAPAERETSYRPAATQVGKTVQELRDIPQSVTVVPETLIRDRQADTLREALRNVAGLTFNAGEGGRIGDNITIRGYSVVGDLYLDGLRDVAQYNREIFNVEQVDVLRGSASMLFGRGATGGIVNQVSKRPLLLDRYDVSLTGGSFDYKRATADLNKTLGDNAALRVNLMKTDTDSSRDVVHQSRWGFAPTLSWGIGTKNEFTLAYYHLEDDNIPDYGVPYFRGRPLAVPRNRFYGLASDYERNSTNITTASWIHRFDNTSQVRTVLRRAEYARDLWATAPRLGAGTSVLTDASVINRQRQARGSVERTTTLQSDYIARADWGGFQHQLLAGLELVDEDATRWTNTGTVANPSTTAGFPDAFAALSAAYFTSRSRTAFNAYRAKTLGLYAQDMVSLTPHWKLLAGVRWDRFGGDYDRPLPAGDLSRTDRAASWRTGVLYQPDETVSYYASAGTSFNPSGELYQLDDRTANTPPEKSRNFEIGAKWDLMDGRLSLRTAAFRTQKYNERNTDLSLVNVAVLSGERHTDGIEFEAAGQITPNWQVFGGTALMSARIDRASGDQAGAQGKRPVNTPRWTANLWTVYLLGGGWRVGAGFDGVGDRYGDANNNNLVPGYIRWDAMLAYEQRNYELRLNVFNLTDRTTYEGVYAGHVVPGAARTVQLTARLKF